MTYARHPDLSSMRVMIEGRDFIHYDGEPMSINDELSLDSSTKRELTELNRRAAEEMASEAWPGCEYREPSPEAIDYVMRLAWRLGLDIEKPS